MKAKDVEKLDETIRHWRRQLRGAEEELRSCQAALEHRRGLVRRAQHYVDALQSARKNLVGEVLE